MAEAYLAFGFLTLIAVASKHGLTDSRTPLWQTVGIASMIVLFWPLALVMDGSHE